jgi:hypothetical protein
VPQHEATPNEGFRTEFVRWLRSADRLAADKLCDATVGGESIETTTSIDSANNRAES